MPDPHQEQWLAILEAASVHPPSEMNAEWTWLMLELGLRPEYFLAVLEAIKQGRWRKARNPKAYLKTVAKREAVKMGLASDEGPRELLLVPPARADGGEMTQEEVLGWISYREGSSEAIERSDGVWRKGAGWDDYDGDDWWEEFDSFRDYLLSRLPDEFKLSSEPRRFRVVDDEGDAGTEKFVTLQPVVTPNWSKLAKSAGFDEWEELALRCRASGKSRDKALSEQADEASRKALQAAWKRLDRTGMKRLREAVNKNASKNVPE